MAHIRNLVCRTTRLLTYEDYTVAWICALPCEFAAAQAVLDEVHPDITIPDEDDNIYALGSIKGHNIVIACLPAGVYGVTSAAVVANGLIRTFNSIELSLMVGIGGGIPNQQHDIRLGDVVVGIPTPNCPAVVQYDFGKTVENGQFERKGHLNKPKRRLLQAVNKLRASHDLGPSMIPVIISEKLRNKSMVDAGYSQPDLSQDVLFEPGCVHVDELVDCQLCGPCQPVARVPRSVRHPYIHYGPIASGNQVMRNSRIRDQIANQLGLLCFEMEAAGMMDDLQCLVIRGICDYCDARKSKEFQKYASLTAASYACELLSMIVPHATLKTGIGDILTRGQKRYREIIQSLDFDEAGFRRHAIKHAHAETCQWLLSDPVYRSWLNDDEYSQHHGFLWIKGKPGTGKSTVMKFLLESARTDGAVVSFFFNARGSMLEKSTIGMYRSLLSQLLRALPELQDSLDIFALPIQVELWNLDILESTFISIVRSVRKPILCFIDALDEGNEDDIREMTAIFAALGRYCASQKLQFRVCFASRYYPYITMTIGHELRIDHIDGHVQDIRTYIDAELPVTQTHHIRDITDLLTSKSDGVFLWVVLATRALKQEYDHGRIENMKHILTTLPAKLSDLFRGIVLRDGHYSNEFMLCMQWLLHTREPLSVGEFYFGMQAGDPNSVLEAWDSTKFTFSDMTRYINSSSKGLAEVILPDDQTGVNKSSKWGPLNLHEPRVQFIHESVREFFKDHTGMGHISDNFQLLMKGPSNEQLKLCCFRYLTADIYPRFSLSFSFAYQEALGIRERMLRKFPLIRYAVRYVLVHADLAHREGYDQESLLGSNVILHWLKLNEVLDYPMDYKLPQDRLIDILIKQHLLSLLRQLLHGYQTSLHGTVQADDQSISPYAGLTWIQYELMLCAVAISNQWSTMKEILLEHTKMKNVIVKHISNESLHFASGQGNKDMVLWLLSLGISPCDQKKEKSARQDWYDWHGYGRSRRDSENELQVSRWSPLGRAAECGQLEIVKILLDAGAPINGGMNASPIEKARKGGHQKVVEFLISRGAYVV